MILVAPLFLIANAVVAWFLYFLLKRSNVGKRVCWLIVLFVFPGWLLVDQVLSSIVFDKACSYAKSHSFDDLPAAMQRENRPVAIADNGAPALTEALPTYNALTTLELVYGWDGQPPKMFEYYVASRSSATATGWYRYALENSTSQCKGGNEWIWAYGRTTQRRLCLEITKIDDSNAPILIRYVRPGWMETVFGLRLSYFKVSDLRSKVNRYYLRNPVALGGWFYRTFWMSVSESGAPVKGCSKR